MNHFGSLGGKLQRNKDFVSMSFHTVVFFYMLLEAVVWMCSVKKVFLEILENSQKNRCARNSFFLSQVFFCEFCEISKGTFFYRTPLVAASVFLKVEKIFSSNTKKQPLEVFYKKGCS